MTYVQNLWVAVKNCLIQRVTASCNVCSWESVLTTGSYFLQILKDSCGGRDIEAKISHEYKALLARIILKMSKIWFAKGSVFYSPMSVIAGILFFHISNTNISANI